MSNRILYFDSARGVYIPKEFAETIPWNMLEGVKEADLETLLEGPVNNNEWYWDVWDHILNTAVVVKSDGTKYRLVQEEGDLWLEETEQSMGFSLELFFEELEYVLYHDNMSKARKLTRLMKIIAQAKAYAKETGAMK